MADAAVSNTAEGNLVWVRIPPSAPGPAGVAGPDADHCDTGPMDRPSLQETYAPAGRCFGCGPANPVGLRIRSVPDESDPTRLLATWQPRPEHEAFSGVVNGGILGTLLDCHANWTATWHLMRAGGLDRPPTTVTLEYTIRMRRPTPSGGPVTVRAWVVAAAVDRATVEAEIVSGDVVTAVGHGTFVAVKSDHPAFDRW
jgi:acyl-coenzyme A thioesterase PaaI-like protein